MKFDSLFSSVRLRTATADDAALLSALGARLFEQTFGADNTAEDMATYLAGAFNPATQAAELAEPERVTWIAEDASGTAIGYAVLIRDVGVDCVVAHRPAELRRIYVDASRREAERGTEGVRSGALLMNRCLDQARDWGCDVIWLAVWQANPRAIRFYEKSGFQRVGVKTFQLGQDLQHDFVMARNL